MLYVIDNGPHVSPQDVLSLRTFSSWDVLSWVVLSCRWLRGHAIFELCNRISSQKRKRFVKLFQPVHRWPSKTAIFFLLVFRHLFSQSWARAFFITRSCYFFFALFKVTHCASYYIANFFYQLHAIAYFTCLPACSPLSKASP